MPTVITLLTDFGTADGYVGEVKGVLMSGSPEAHFVDISHEIERHDTVGARLALARYWRRFPLGTIHLVVVDPGVGSDRAAIAVESGGYFLVGPDSGVLSPALLSGQASVVQLPVPSSASHTFHGRDIFAPAAAALASGSAFDALGTPFHTPTIVRTPEPRRMHDGSTEGEVIHLDRFGNAATNIIWRGGAANVEVNDYRLSLLRTYTDVESGEPVALVGSNGLIEIAVREGSAGARLGISRGTRVRVVQQ